MTTFRRDSSVIPAVSGFAAGHRGFQVHYIAGQMHAAALGTGAPAIDTLLALPILYRGPGRIDLISFRITTAGGAGSVARVGVYRSRSKVDLRPDALLFDGGEQDGTVIGMKTTVIPEPKPELDPEWVFWLVYFCGVAAPTLRTISGAACYPIFGNDAGGGTNIHIGRSTGQAYGALPDPFPSGANLVATAVVPALYYRLVGG